MLVYFTNDKHISDRKQAGVFYYNEEWSRLGHSRTDNAPLAGRPILEILQFNLVLSTYHHLEDKQPTEGEKEPLNDDSNTNKLDPILVLIRYSRVNTPATS